MAAPAACSLFKTIISNPNHVLRSLCTLRPTIQYNLALDLTLSTSQLVTIETFSPALSFLVHTNNNNLSLFSVTSHHSLYLYPIFSSTFMSICCFYSNFLHKCIV